MRQNHVFCFSLFLFVCAALLTGSAAADTPLAFTPPGDVRVDMWLRQTVTLQTTPGYASLGIDCGLADMCGIDPCTCGSADEWGHCSCNGTKKTAVSYKVTVDNPKVAGVTVSGGKLLVKGLSPGSTKVTVTAQLKHYTSAAQTVTVTVGPPWYLLWLVPLGAAAAAAIVVLRKAARRKKLMKQGETKA